MSNIQIFNYQSNEVRTVEMGGEPWFVLKDVCTVLGISHITDTAKRMEEDEVGQTEVIDSMGRKQSTYIINESGLFEVKEAKNDKTQWSGVQTLITPKGRETFRLLYL